MLRQRKKDDFGWSPESYSEKKHIICGPRIYKLSTLLATFVIIFGWFALYSIVLHLNERLPPMVHKYDEETYKDRFIGERAKDFLTKLAKIGVKVIGSYENEVSAVALIEHEINLIMSNASGFNKLSFDHQITNGSYFLKQPVGFISTYENVQNLIVKIGPPDASNETSSLLVNCHFDSAPSSPGASDDGLNCAVMLEVLRVLSQQKYVLDNNVIFLFNGAEETPLQASHGFITKHKWATGIRAFINLESCGAGGREILFQAGPQNPWLVEIYKKAAEHPFGNVLGEDIFQGGLVPSDTDFRIFRDYGHLAGLDFAHCENGYVYHTRLDDTYMIKDGVYQHTGDNMLSLVRHFASYKMLANPDEKDGRIVYFDLGGLFFITYSETTGIILNLAAVSLSVYTVLQNIFIYTAGMPRKEIGKQLIMSVLIPGLGLILAIVFVIIIAVILDFTGSVLSWYSKPYLVLPLFFAPTLAAFFLPPLLLNKIKSSNLCDGVRVQLYCNGVQLLWTLGLFIATFSGLRSAYILFICVIFTALTNLILSMMNLQHDVTKWLIGYCLSSIIPALYFVYLYILAMALFIPIAGRSGANINPELLIGILAALLCSLVFGYVTPVILLVWKPWRLIYGLLAINAVTLLLVIITPFGFPFAENTPQRLVVLHTGRSFYNGTGDEIKTDGGMWLMHIDRRAPRTYNAISWFKNVKNIDEDCKKYIFCGVPLYYSRIANTERNPGSWVPAPPPLIPERDTRLQLNSISYVLPDVKRFNFTAVGAHQMLVFFSPKDGIKLIDWSFDEEPPSYGLSWDSRPTYIIRFSAGGSGESELNFYLDLGILPGYNTQNFHLDIALAGHYIEDMTRHKNDLLKDYTKSFLTWGHVTTWISLYRSYIY
ncbi:endoplasmic reticulum metallopeptidase 1-like isoform X2 [Lycorma delicatula]